MDGVLFILDQLGHELAQARQVLAAKDQEIEALRSALADRSGQADSSQ